MCGEICSDMCGERYRLPGVLISLFLGVDVGREGCVALVHASCNESILGFAEHQ